MIFTRVLALTALAPLFAMGAPENGVFDLKVARVRTLRDQPGDLHIDIQGIAFRSTDGKTTIAIAMKDLRDVSVADRHALRFGTYEVQKWKPMERVEYTFRAPPDTAVEELGNFLTAHVHRTVIGHYHEESQFQAAAYHRRVRGGASGLLRIGPESIQFVSDKPADSRTWLYRDIETIGRPDAFRFRVTTNRETYVLELKEDLPEAGFQLAWTRVYGLDMQPAKEHTMK
jgi:hypothetical protein